MRVPYGRGTGAPHPIDVRVGERLRQRRVLLGMSQSDLSNLLNLTFQQLQKYERGANRISAGRLHYIARLLEVPVEWFFYPITPGEPVSREELELLSLYHQLSPKVAARYLDLVRTAGGAA